MDGYGGPDLHALIDLAELEGGAPPMRVLRGLRDDGPPPGRWEPVMRTLPNGIVAGVEGYEHPASDRVAIFRTPTNGDGHQAAGNDRGWSVYWRDGPDLQLRQIGTGTLSECVELGEAAVLDG